MIRAKHPGVANVLSSSSVPGSVQCVGACISQYTTSYFTNSLFVVSTTPRPGGHESLPQQIQPRPLERQGQGQRQGKRQRKGQGLAIRPRPQRHHNPQLVKLTLPECHPAHPREERACAAAPFARLASLQQSSREPGSALVLHSQSHSPESDPTLHQRWHDRDQCRDPVLNGFHKAPPGFIYPPPSSNRGT